MAKKEKVEVGEQMDLIDVAPEFAKPIIAAAKVYKKASAARQAALAEEVKLKQKVLGLVKQAKIKPNKEGVTKFRYKSIEISITPRDELLKVKDDEGD